MKGLEDAYVEAWLRYEEEKQDYKYIRRETEKDADRSTRSTWGDPNDPKYLAK